MLVQLASGELREQLQRYDAEFIVALLQGGEEGRREFESLKSGVVAHG